MTGPLLAPGREAAAYALDEHRVPPRHRRDVVEFRNLRLSGAEPLDPAAEAVHSCAR